MLLKEHNNTYKVEYLYLTMNEIMLIYDIPGGNDTTRIAFNRKLFNYNVQSHQGKYKRKSKGILPKYEKPTKSCVIFKKEYLSKVKKLCNELKIQYMLYQVKRLWFIKYTLFLLEWNSRAEQAKPSIERAIENSKALEKTEERVEKIGQKTEEKTSKESEKTSTGLSARANTRAEVNTGGSKIESSTSAQAQTSTKSDSPTRNQYSRNSQSSDNSNSNDKGKLPRGLKP